MKKTAILFLLASILVTGIQAQSKSTAKDTTKSKANTEVTSDGNYKAITRARLEQTKPKDTGKTYTDSKGVKYPVYQGPKGGLFIYRTSQKTGKEYKYYLKVKK